MQLSIIIRVVSVAFSPNGEWLATGSSDGNARIIEVATEIVKHAIQHDDWVAQWHFRPIANCLQRDQI